MVNIDNIDRNEIVKAVIALKDVINDRMPINYSKICGRFFLNGYNGGGPFQKI